MEEVEVDYDSAAQAKMSLEMTKLFLEMNHRAGQIAEDYYKEKTIERNIEESDE